MADQKISALTAATTPLGGTEVLPIVQAGVTKKVSVANLTAGRAISATTVSAKALSLSNTGVYTATEQYFDDPGALGNYGNSLVVFSNSNPSSYFQRLIPIRGAYLNQMGWRLTINNAGTEQNAWTADWNGNVTIDTGNLVIGTSGKGIDFSATSDATGMTSELLDDYEEGTWTPSFIFSTAGDFSLGSPIVQIGHYTKVGRLVTCHFSLVTTPTWTTASSYLEIHGLPFTATASAGGGYGINSFTNVTKAGYVQFVLEAAANATFMYLTGSSNAGLAGSSVIASDMSSGTQTVLQGTISYIV